MAGQFYVSEKEIEKAKRHIDYAVSAFKSIEVDIMDENNFRKGLSELDMAKRELDEALRHVRQLMRD